MNILTDVQIGYLAGIVDGEGTISLGRTLKRRDWGYSMQVAVTNTNLKLLNWCKNITNIGTIDKASERIGPKRKQVYSWRVAYKDIPLFLMTIKTHLIIKKEQAELMLEYFEKCRGTSNNEVPDEILILRSIIYEELRELNKKGD